MTLLPYWGRITKLARAVIAQQLLIATSPVYYDTQQRVVDEQMATMTKALSDRVGEIVTMTQEKQHAINEAACSKLNKKIDKPNVHGCNHDDKYGAETEYNRDTAMCKITRIKWYRQNCRCGAGCPWKSVTREEEVPLPMPNRMDLRGENKGIEEDVDAKLESYKPNSKNW